MPRTLPGRRLGPVLLVLVLLTPLTAGAETWVVNPGESIGAALDGASAGDQVVVHGGIYQEQGLVLPDGVELLGETGDPGDVTIASVGGAPTLTCTGPGFTSRVVGITFAAAAGGMADDVPRGGGVLCVDASPGFVQCRFDSLKAAYGAAVFVKDGAPQFNNCEFRGNTAIAVGGAVACVGDAVPTLLFCVLAGNTAGVSGSAINAALGATPILTSCTLDGHPGSSLAGWDGAPMTVDKTIITGDGGVFLGEGSALPTFSCSDLYGAADKWTGLLAPQAGVAGNFAAKPFYCSDGSYRLNLGSPCTAAENPGCGFVGARSVGCDDVSAAGGAGVPVLTRLHPCFPNPFNPRTTVRFDLNRSGPVRIDVYDLAGRRVRRLLTESLPAGTHEAVWEGDGQDGHPVAAGVYFIRMDAVGVIDTRRVALVK